MEKAHGEFGRPTVITSDQVAEIKLKLLLRDAAAELIEILRNRPELNQYVPQDNFKLALQVFRNLKKTLKKYPQLFEDLAEFAEMHPQQIAMAVLPLENLVITQTSTGVEGLVPVLTCTKFAIGDLREKIREQGRPYGLIASRNELVPYLFQRFETEDEPIISYRRRTMKPEDYLALAATRIFYNEVFHFRIDKAGNISR